jgi:ubiquinone/menaquinone biosynthesis C-methylase UbiE
MKVINRNALSYDSSAAAYDRGRPGYPAEAINAIVNKFQMDDCSTVVDLGAGTGKFTRTLLSTDARVLAVEPVQGMRAELRLRSPGIGVVAGLAEAIPLANGSADVVTVAQAFHWFDPKKAVAEIHRILRPEGGVALIWNRRDMGQQVQRLIHDIVLPYRGDTSSQDESYWKSFFNLGVFFTPLTEQSFRHRQIATIEGLIDRILSFSYIAALPHDKQAAVSAQLDSLKKNLPEVFPLDYITYLFTATRL